MAAQPQPLAGIRVLDLSRVLAGLYCALLLSMLGAEVTKVEEQGGDESRTWPPKRGELGSPYLGMNLNKRGIVVNLKSPAGVAVVKDLAAASDVLVENFKTGTMEKFGLGYETMRAINPRLVYTSISAFGRTGPKAGDPGYEALVQAYSGVMDMTGFADGPPVRCGVSFLDMSTGINAALAFGIELTSNFLARDSFSPTLTFPNFIFLPNFLLTSSTIGPIITQGMHHSAKKSMNTKPFFTNSSNSFPVSSATLSAIVIYNH